MPEHNKNHDIMDKTKKVKDEKYGKLGFEKEEAFELVESLNLLLANYAVTYQKLRNFHWNVVGPDFYDVHEKLEEQYEAAATDIDEIAERVRILGFKPLSTLASFLDKAEIEEPSDKDYSSDEMMQEVIADYETLISFMVDVIETAAEYGDIGTDNMVQGMMKRLEKEHWMISSFIS